MYQSKTEVPKFPHPEREFIATLYRLLVARGERDEAALLANSAASLTYDSYENLDGGTHYWKLTVRMPVEQYGKLIASPDDRTSIERTLQIRANELLPEFGIGVAPVAIAPLVGPALRVVENVNNQGFAHPKNIAGIVDDGLRFRSRAEVNLHHALRKLDVTVAPLPVFLRGPRRIEPDFVMIKDGIVLVVEIDGPTMHSETPVDAEQRLSMFKHEGVFTERVRADDCMTEAGARQVADRLLALIARYRNMR